MTQLTEAQAGRITPEVEAIARDEGVSNELVMKGVALGRIVIPSNHHHHFKAVGIGTGLATKVNANIGTSPSHHDLDEELAKLSLCVQAGAHSVMDLSTGGDLRAIRRAILDASPVMVGTVPIYGVATQLERQGKGILGMTSAMLFDEIEAQCEEGVDFITVHCGVTKRSLQALETNPRVAGIVSRGGSLLARWIGRHSKENPLYEEFDRLLDICSHHDVTLSLGDGLRPGSVLDATDAPQIEELAISGELARRSRDVGVQVMIEGPGHVPLDQIAANVHLQKRICDGAPFYVLGPLTTDIAAGFDHVAASIGGAVAAMHGADFLCYVTAAEHLRLPTLEEVRDGVVAARVAAHSADIVKLGDRALRLDRVVSEARRNLDWDTMLPELLDPVTARHKRSESEDKDRDVCTMCGDLCAVRMYNQFAKAKEGRSGSFRCSNR
jgi:phosphomethylpyrimidine synthase